MSKRLAATALALGLIAASCGGDSSDTAATTTSATAAPATTAGPATSEATATTEAASSDTTEAAAPAPPECEPVGDLTAASSTVTLELDEFSFEGGPLTVPAGSVGFDLVNIGRAPHELIVIEADSYESLPLNEHGTVIIDEVDAAAVIGQVDRWKGGGTSCSGVFDLDPGAYVLVCNIEFQNGPEVISHAGRGMAESFAVTG